MKKIARLVRPALLCLLLALAAVGMSRVVSGQAPAPPPATSKPPAVQYPTVTSEMTLAATGDSIILRPVSVYEHDPAFGRLLGLIRGATVAFTNFELNVFDTRKFEPVPQAEYGGLWLHASPREARELKWMGFHMVSRANNHTTDYGVEGMNETDAVLDEVGLVHAGSGQTLGQARAPAYFQTAAGRVALISVASSFSTSSRAMDARPDIKGRPGLNGLRTNRILHLDPVAFEALRRVMQDELKAVSAPPAGAGASGRPAPLTEFNLYGTLVKKADKARLEFAADPRDVKALVDSVRGARRQADVVMVGIHAHEPGNGSETPADFLPLVARAAIDAGADMVVGSGPHRLRGIEIFKGRPIFYSLGNFIYQCYTLEPQGADVYDNLQRTVPALDILNSSIADLYDAKPTGFGSNVSEEVWWESVAAIARFAPGRLLSIELHPLELGFGTPRPQIGTPRMANPTAAAKIIERLARLSKPYGTTIRFVDGKGVIDLAAQQTALR